MRYGALTGTTLTAALTLAAAAETYRGIDVAPEHRCAPRRPRRLSLLPIS